MKKKRMIFFPYRRWPVLLISLPLPIMIFGAVALFLVMIFQGMGPVWILLFLFAAAAMYFAVAVVIGFVFVREVLFTCAPIEISEKGISRGFVNRETYTWDQVTQFGVTLLDPPERGINQFERTASARERSIYLVFGLPGEPPALEWDISRFGVDEFWYRSERAERILGKAYELFKALDRIPGGNGHDEVYDCFFPKRFMAMKFTTERFLLINSYLKAAGFVRPEPSCGESSVSPAP